MRLTNEIKDQLTQNLLEGSPLFEQAKQVVAERVKLVEEIRQHLLKQFKLSDEKIDELKISILDNPLVGVSTCRGYYIRFAMNGESRELRTNGLDEIRRFNERQIDRTTLKGSMFFGTSLGEDVPAVYTVYGHTFPIITKPGKLYDRLLASDAAIKKLFDDSYAFRQQVKGALSSVTTVNKLKEVWSDAVPFLPPAAKPQSTALALPVDTLNAICGLPK